MMSSKLFVVMLLGLGVFLLAAIGMALGVLITGKRLKGSCGGVMGPDGQALGDCLCARKGTNACDRVAAGDPPVQQ